MSAGRVGGPGRLTPDLRDRAMRWIADDPSDQDRLELQRVLAAAMAGNAEAVLVPDTAMHTLAIVDKLEAAVGKPVLTANQVTVWKGLELLGAPPTLPGLGTLFEARR